MRMMTLYQPEISSRGGAWLGGTRGIEPGPAGGGNFGEGGAQASFRDIHTDINTDIHTNINTDRQTYIHT